MSRLLKWERNATYEYENDIDWVVREEWGEIIYRVANNWNSWGDTKIYAIAYISGGPELVQVESPKAGIRWCEAHYVLCR